MASLLKLPALAGSFNLWYKNVSEVYMNKYRTWRIVMFEIETTPHVDAYDEKDIRHEFSGENIQQAFSRMLEGICSQDYNNPRIVPNLNIRSTSGEPFFHCLIITELKAEQAPTSKSRRK